MRAFSSAVTQLLASDNVSVCYLVKLVTPSITIRDTTAGTTIVVPSLGTFNPNNGLLVVEGPRLSSAVDRETYHITYADPEFNKRELFELGLTGSAVSTYVVFFNTSGATLGGAAPGEPLVNAEDIITAYSGIVDSHGYGLNPQEGTIVAAIECSSPMASLGLSRPFYTSKEAMRKLDPDDCSFDFVNVTSSKIAHLWGKA